MEEQLESVDEAVTAGHEQLRARRKLGVPIAATRRFFEIEGLDLGGLLALELFTTVIPLILIGFGWASGFSSRLSFGDLLIRQLELNGTTAQQVRNAFGSGASLKSSWTVVGLASFLVWGIPMSSQVAKTFARAWRRQRYPFLSEVWRGAVWFVLFLTCQALTVAISPGRTRGVGDVLLNLVGLLPQFLLWFATPAILIRDGARAWRHLVWCGLVGVLLDTVFIRIATRVLLPALLSGWVGFGPIGVAMTLMTWCTVLAALWVVTACLGAVLWERTAPLPVVLATQIAEADRSPGTTRR